MSGIINKIGRENIMETGKPKSIAELLEDFKRTEQVSGEKLKFTGVGNKDVYNTTAPFEYEGERYLIGRVESPDKDTDYQSVFFTNTGGSWSPATDIPTLRLQDPFIIKLGDKFVVGGVEVYPKPSEQYPDNLSYRTAFYQGKITELQEFTQGPELMKDLRIVKLANGRIGVFTRPGDIFSRPKDKIGGMIGYTEINSLSDLKAENINKAEIINGLFIESEWGGANELYLLENDQIGVIGHIARINPAGEKEYYAISWEFNPGDKQFKQVKIITTRDNFSPGKSKVIEYGDDRSTNYLKHIIFPGGIDIKSNNEVDLYVGLSDCEEGKIRIAYPFSVGIKNK